jgi:hypothetical protein
MWYGTYRNGGQIWPMPMEERIPDDYGIVPKKFNSAEED